MIGTMMPPAAGRVFGWAAIRVQPGFGLVPQPARIRGPARIRHPAGVGDLLGSPVCICHACRSTLLSRHGRWLNMAAAALVPPRTIKGGAPSREAPPLIPAAIAAADQFLVLSTSRLAEIHGIIARSFSPTSSI